ncbi:MAG: hypothetical protein ACYTFG_05255 [Planctomycetota bacterium]|jgi:hypothetical protein
MNINEVIRKNIKLIVAVTVVVIVLPLCYSVVAFALSKGTQSSTPFLELPDAKNGKCILDARTMRFTHWHVLYEARDEAMREGKEPKVTFKKCAGCHTSREKFCDKCHNVVNFYPDCFGCHYYPK